MPEPEELTIGPARTGQPHRWLAIAAALVVGLVVGRLSQGHIASHDRSHAPTSPYQQASSKPAARTVEVPGCPPDRTCTARPLHVPRLLSLLRSTFPDLLTARIMATDDTASTDRYRAWLVATLARGLTLELIADNAAAAPAVATPWVFVAVGESQRAEHAERTIVAALGNGPVLHITITAGKNAAPNLQIGMPCDWCHRTIPRSEAAARLQGLTRVSSASVLSVIATGIHAADDPRVLSWFP